MDNIEFENTDLKNELLNDGVEFVQNMAEESSNTEPVVQSGKKRVSFILLGIGIVAFISSFFFHNAVKYITMFVALLLSYYIFFEKNKEKTSYKFDKLSRIIAIVLLSITIITTFLFKYNVL